MGKGKHLFSGVIQKQNLEFGLILVLTSCVLAYLNGGRIFIAVAILLCLITIVFPVIFTPLTALWFGLSHILGKVSSTILLSFIFYLVVAPIGILRRAIGKDTLRLKQFKTGRQSVMTVRTHLYKAAELKDTF